MNLVLVIVLFLIGIALIIKGGDVFILSICALFSPFAIKRSDYLLKGILMVLAAACIYIFSLKGSLSILGSILLLAIFIVFVIENIRSAKRDMIESDTEKPEGKEIWINVIKFLLGTNRCGSKTSG